MIESRKRPLTDKERGLLARLAAKRDNLGNDFASAGCLAALILAPAAWILKLLRLERWQPLAACVALLIGIAFALRMRRRYQKLVPGRRANLKDLENGFAEEITYDAVDAVRVEEFEDLGSNYYLRLADGKVLFLSGQYLYEPETENGFPNTRFRRTVAPQSRLLLNFECLGAYFAPSSTRPSFTTEEFRSGRIPNDGTILDADFEALRHGVSG